MGSWFQLTGWIGALDSVAVLAARALLASMLLWQYSSKKNDLYNVLWMLVFGFATLNILALVTRQLDPHERRRMAFGEILAVMVVVTCMFLLTWEMLNLFHVFPLKLQSH